MTRVGFYTLGCKVSQYETEAVAEEFSRRGFAIGDFSEENDIYVINTCTVTSESDRKCRQTVRRARKINPASAVLVMGCYSQRDPAALCAIDGVYAVVGTENKLSLADLAEKYISERDAGEGLSPVCSVTDVTKACFEPMRITRAPRTRAYVKIQDGCESKCTYCAISKARGRLRSKLPSDVISELSALTASGVSEIVLTGIETAAYGRDLAEKISLSELMVLIDENKAAKRIRLGSLAPELIDEKLIDVLRRSESFAPHFHLSIQSGSSRVLRAMKRRYNREMLLSKVEKIKEAIPRATFTADLMVGFPGEDEKDLLDTLNIVSEIGLLDAHVFAYSRREGTEAYFYKGQISEEDKRKRSARLIEEKNKVRESVLSDIVRSGKPLSVIPETISSDGFFTAHSDTYVEVRFLSRGRAYVEGRIVKVLPVSHKSGIVYAELL